MSPLIHFMLSLAAMGSLPSYQSKLWHQHFPVETLLAGGSIKGRTAHRSGFPASYWANWVVAYSKTWIRGPYEMVILPLGVPTPCGAMHHDESCSRCQSPKMYPSSQECARVHGVMQWSVTMFSGTRHSTRRAWRLLLVVLIKSWYAVICTLVNTLPDEHLQLESLWMVTLW